MSELGLQIIDNARSRIGAPFQSHFEPKDLCNFGYDTVDSCMERGMDERGYDCSGLVIASLCDVLEIATNSWPRELRHPQQLMSLATDEGHEPGDMRVFISQKGRPHVAITVTEHRAIHAGGVGGAGVVREGLVRGRDGQAVTSRTIALGSLVSLLSQR